jgi:hypothetical protein
MHKIFIPWLLSTLLSWAPPGRSVETYPEAKETKEEAVARYTSIANDFLEIAFDPEEKPLFAGNELLARQRTAVLLASIALKESGFRKDVDFGHGKMARGDQGRSVCLMQVNVGKEAVEVRGQKWFAEDLLSDRKKCIRAALHRVRRSFNACRGPLDVRLAVYTSGNCEKGLRSSSERINAFRRAWSKNPAPRIRTP